MNREYIQKQEAVHKDWDRVGFAVKMVNEALEEVERAFERYDNLYILSRFVHYTKVEV